MKVSVLPTTRCKQKAIKEMELLPKQGRMTVLGLALVLRGQLHIIPINVPKDAVVTLHDFKHPPFEFRVDGL